MIRLRSQAFANMATLLLLVLCAPRVFAATGNYLGVSVGSQIVSNMDSNFLDSGTTSLVAAKTGFRNGYNFGMVWGWQQYQYRYEIAADYHGSSLDELLYNDAAQGSVSGRLRLINVMGNVLLNFEDHSPNWSPFIGLGLGVSNDKLFLNSSTLGTDAVTINEGMLAYQGIAGISYLFDGNTSFRLSYHYLKTLAIQQRFTDSVGAKINGQRDGLLNHVFKASLVYRF